MSISSTNRWRAIRQWLRLVRPPGWLMATAAVDWLICEGLYVATGLMFGQWIGNALFRSRDTLLILVSLLYGVHRVRRTHPVFDQHYFLWLVRTPWRRGLPLLRGPVHLVPQDVLYVGLLAALVAHQPQFSGALIPAGFLAGYLSALAAGLWLIGERLAAYGLFFLLGLAVRCVWESPVAALAVLVFGYCVGVRAHWRSLLRFPWLGEIQHALETLSRQFRALQRPAAATLSAGAADGLPELPALWPYGLLHHRHDERSLPRRDAWAVGLLLGWWVYALFAAAPNGAFWPLYFYLQFAALFAWLLRAQRYLSGHLAPLSLFGRLATGHWLIPGFDRVLLAPLAIVLISLLLPLTLFSAGLPASACIGVTTSAVVLIALAAPPPLRHWQLTAPVRIKPLANKTSKAAVQEI